MTHQEHADKIHNEKCPYLRLIWDMGYTHFSENLCNREYVLYGEHIGEKRIDKWEFRNMAMSLTIKGGVMKDSEGMQIGEPHYWISDGDGSADIFREFLKPTLAAPPIS